MHIHSDAHVYRRERLAHRHAPPAIRRTVHIRRDPSSAPLAGANRFSCRWPRLFVAPPFNMTHQFPCDISNWQVFQALPVTSEARELPDLADYPGQTPTDGGFSTKDAARNICQSMSWQKLSGKSVCQILKRRTVRCTYIWCVAPAAYETLTITNWWDT